MDKKSLLETAQENLTMFRFDAEKHWFNYVQAKREIRNLKKLIHKIKKEIKKNAI